MKHLEFYDVTAPISACKIGRVVAVTNLSDKSDYSLYEYGHIYGFARDDQGELLLKVLLESKNDYDIIHPANCVLEDL